MWKYFIESIQGKKTRKNQDYQEVNEREDKLLAIVCDGLGGAPSGEVASRLCVKSIADSFLEEYNPPYTKEWMIEIVKEANRFLYDYSVIHSKCNGMGTTMVALLINNDKGIVANVGDSRLYSYEKDQLVQITEDDSLVWEQFRKGKLKKDEMIRHPSSHLITKHIAMGRDIDLKPFEISIAKKQLFLLCSDGITDYLTDEKIHSLIDMKTTLEENSQKIIEAALNEDSDDDISIILLSNYMS
ncbi:MAG: protein phosphatase 2C domain-containing protein [Candidatus Cloacimonetes bacterium]|nr:protein phosphatase 2C domain-containing protein [Candidatus Cloacimonadota bacterium]